MRHFKPFAAALAFALLALPGSANAQTAEPGYTYTFIDDSMVGDTLSSPPPEIRLRHPSPRIMLLRPRASFVGEMLKSVEEL